MKQKQYWIEFGIVLYLLALLAACGDDNGSISSTDQQAGSGSINVWSYLNPSIKYGEFTDERDGQVYKSVKIGEQTWMAQNLNYRYLQRTELLDSSSFCYRNEPDSCKKYGRLYLWSAAVDSVGEFSKDGEGLGYDVFSNVKGDVRGICPEGWHLPSVDEFRTLIKFAGGYESSFVLKARKGWEKDYFNGTDDYGFSLLGAGEFKGSSSYSAVGAYTEIWSSSQRDSKYSYKMQVYSNENINLMHFQKDEGSSVRCIKNSDQESENLK